MYSIMIVEDEELVRQGLTSLVNYEQFGMKVIDQAENGRIAWEKFQVQPADLLLTDINMPQLNGLDLAQLVREKAPSCHIIFLTGYDDFEFAQKAIRLGADDYLLKPFSKADIEEMLEKVKNKLDEEGKKAQVETLVDQGDSTELEEAIHSRLADSQLTLKDLALQLGFSPSYLSVLIKKTLGLPFQEYLIQERMKKAKLLLLTTDLKIYEIADQVGFEDMNYFSQRFKQVVGVTPRQYKKGEHE